MTAAILFELAWKSGLLAAAALLGAALLRTRPAAERVLVLRLGVVMIAGLPLAAAVLPAMQVQAPVFAAAPATPTASALAAPADPGVAPPVATAAPPAPVSRPAAPAWTLDAGRAALILWAVGACLLLLRLGAGVATLHRWTRRAEPVSDARWLAALDRAAPDGALPVLRATPRVHSPLSWGVRPAVILLNPEALDQADRAEAVLTHEMGHVRHADWLFLMLARLLVAVLWFNPLVWLLQRELARQSEQAADAWAVRRIDRAAYATALVAMAARGRPHAALGMAAPRGELARRVAAIMAGSARQGRPWSTAFAIAGCVGLATPLAAVELAPRTVAAQAVAAPRPARLQAPGSIAPAPSTTRADADARLSGATLAKTLPDRTDERAPDTKGQTVNSYAIEADSIQVDASGVVRAGGRDLRINTSGTVQVSPGLGVSAPVAVQIPSDPPAPPQAWAARAAERAAAEAEMRDAARQRVESMRESARQLREGAAQMEAGAAEVERSAATADPARRRDSLHQAGELRRQAGELRRQADAMEAGAQADP
jgi:beta-lactamase regulating signal transducer with metallopeptidase domain